jgi:hypothetical protein
MHGYRRCFGALWILRTHRDAMRYFRQQIGADEGHVFPGKADRMTGF